MSIQFVAQPCLTAHQIKMCQSYLLSLDHGHTPANDLLGFIHAICRYFGSTIDELTWSLARFKAYDNQVRCQHCGIMQEVTQPITLRQVNQTMRKIWVCNVCQQFLHGNISKQTVNYSTYTQVTNDLPF